MNEIVNSNQSNKNTQTQLTTQNQNEVFKKFFSTIKNLKQDEIDVFIEICKASKLNPLKNEVHVLKFKESYQIVTNYKVYVERVFASGLLLGLKHEFKKSHNLHKGKDDVECIVYVKRKLNDNTVEFTYSTFFSDVESGAEIWTKQPSMMHLKTTLSRALRLYFPEIVNELPYTLEEMQSQGQEIVLEQTTNKQFTPKQIENNFDNERLMKLEQAIRRVYKEETARGNKNWKQVVIEKNKNGKNIYTDEEINFIFQIIEDEENAK